MLTNRPLVVDAGQSAVVSRTTLQVDDPDNPQDVLLMVLEPPRHGRLTRLHGDRPLTQFKLEELWREQVQYVHDGSVAPGDSLLLQINDGHSYRNLLFHIQVTQKVWGGEVSQKGVGQELCKILFLYPFIFAAGNTHTNTHTHTACTYTHTHTPID